MSQTSAFGSATLHEAAGQIGALPSVIKPIDPGMRVHGPAFTARSAPRNNLWLHRALATAAPGDVIVAEVGGWYEAGYWGEIMTVAAQTREIAGLVLDGCVRDVEQIASCGFPVFSRGACIRGTSKDPESSGALGEPITLGEVTIHPGDLVVGDADGVVIVPSVAIDEVLAKARERESNEAEIMNRLRRGETTLDIYGFR
ncbi:MAG TPA: RraA family protein [Vicinamibacteria bacterium]|nr:RraA family protein [Vicinamibacteria bacterium]